MTTTSIVPSAESRLGPVASERVLAAVDEALSSNTRTMYQSAGRRYLQWCRDQHLAESAPEVVADYLVERSEAGRKRSTLELDRSAIAHHFRSLGLSDAQNPALHNGVGQALRGLRRRGSEAQDRAGQRQARPLTANDLAAITATARLPRRTSSGGRVETVDAADRRGRTDIALAHLLHNAGLRRSEATRARWSDLLVEDDGSGLLAVPYGKTHADPRLVYIPQSTVEALEAIRPDDDEARMFPWTTSTVNRRLQAACAAAGLGSGYSGHSGRVGMAQRLVAAGAPTALIQQQGRWKSPAMISTYARKLDARAVAQYLD